MKNNLKTLIILLLSMTWQTSQAQNTILKTGLFYVPTASGYHSIIDVGFEQKITEKWSCQLSYSTSSAAGDDFDRSKKVWSLQARRYLDNTWTSSVYYGFVLQKLDMYDYTSWYVIPNNDTLVHTAKPDIKKKKYGIGGIVGSHFNIIKRIGADVHIGVVGQIGQKTTSISSAQYGKLLPTKIENNNTHFDIRLLWGVNIYIALGKM
jgi:hypothetical protein